MPIILFVLVALFLGACSDSSTDDPISTRSDFEEVKLSASSSSMDVDEGSSSSEFMSDSSLTNQGVSSAKDSLAESSSSADVVESSSADVVESSSSVGWTKSLDVKWDALPFDTANVKPQRLHYWRVEDFFDAEAPSSAHEIAFFQERYGEELPNFAFVSEDDGYCHIANLENGKVHTTYVSESMASDCILIVHEDSLLFTNVGSCLSLQWGECRASEYAYTRKITVGEDVFYYGEFEKYFLLIQLTDSTIVNWFMDNPYYIPPENESFKWDKSLFVNDSMVQFIGDDTLFIPRYNVKITDNQMTWVFENETCTSSNYKSSNETSVEEQCKAYEKYVNDGIECIRRNMGVVSEELYPKLCRPFEGYSYDIWCILDDSLDDLLK